MTLHPGLRLQIEQDLAPWPKITREMVSQAKLKGCHLHLKVESGCLQVLEKNCSWETRTDFTLQLIEQASKLTKISNCEFVVWCGDKREGDESGSFPCFAITKRLPSKLILYPDFTFAGWPEVHVTDWASSLDRIAKFADSMPWSERVPKLFFRGARTCPLREQVAIVSSQRPELFDIELTAWDRSNPSALRISSNGLSLYEHARYRYLCSIPGHTYASRIKWLLATGSTVIHIDNGWREFWYGLLSHCSNCFFVPERELLALPGLIETLVRDDARASAVGLEGRRLMFEALGARVPVLYWAEILKAYAARFVV